MICVFWVMSWRPFIYFFLGLLFCIFMWTLWSVFQCWWKKKSAVLWNRLLNAFPPRPRPSSHWQRKRKKPLPSRKHPCLFPAAGLCHFPQNNGYLSLWLCGCVCPGAMRWMLDKQTSFVPRGTTCTHSSPLKPLQQRWCAWVKVCDCMCMDMRMHAHARCEIRPRRREQGR